MKTNTHALRAHSKYSASGSERWLNCAASVELEEMSPPSKDTFWSLEGTRAHEVLEQILLGQEPILNFDTPDEMIEHVQKCAKEIFKIQAKKHKLLVEKRVYNTEVHPEMFGTCDAIIPAYGECLHIIDFKYGSGHVVDAVKNTQLIQYALAVAETYFWDEQLLPKIKMHIMQPRGSTKNWHKVWTISMRELKNEWLPLWHKGVARVEKGLSKPFAGAHCHWCRAKDHICPLKNEIKLNRTIDKFKSINPFTEGIPNGKEENSKKESSQKGVKKHNPFEEKSEGKKSKAREKSFDEENFGGF